MTESVEWFLTFDSFSDRFSITNERPDTVSTGRIKVWGPLVSRRAAERKKSAVKRSWNTSTCLFSSQTSADVADVSEWIRHGFTLRLEKEGDSSIDFSTLLRRIRTLATENCLSVSVVGTKRGYTIRFSLWGSRGSMR